MNQLKIGSRVVGAAAPTYFIADVAANHDGDLQRAKDLVTLAKEAGADAAKFQNFQAAKIVSKRGFEQLGKHSHQAKWKKSVFDVYKDASIPFEWTPKLAAHCRNVGIDYFSSPYDFEAVDMLEPHVPAYKIGSGDITWLEMLDYIGRKEKPVIIAAGASTLDDVVRAMETLAAVTDQIALLQCNTNYTASSENFDYINLDVLKTFRALYPDTVLGLSDHTPGHSTVLGSVALGGRIVEKHFTDDTTRQGPDHAFSMTPAAWREMVDRTRELERALGSGVKTVEPNELATVVAQRRCLRTATDLKAGTILTRDLIDVLRPAPHDAIFPHQIGTVIGRRLSVDLPAGEYLKWHVLES